ncbi:hypothetical protein NQ317_017617 [Molorchus minor]|uniref:Uncharacterized protein n=1 Tax=Molorchus minor TaxID=1323400 RepID=A0ABQ9IT29_9CUCU|nr:hypothetical protein NQ317_017617 [Molorchus minor]
MPSSRRKLGRLSNPPFVVLKMRTSIRSSTSKTPKDSPGIQFHCPLFVRKRERFKEERDPMNSVRSSDRNFFIINKSLCDCGEEVEILLRYGQHPGIWLKGGDLLDYMMKKGSLSENEAAAV